MLYVTGDTHGEISRFLYANLKQILCAEDTLFVAGDFGFLFTCDYAETQKRKRLAQLPYTVAFVDGNHENFQALHDLPLEHWCGGKVHVIERDDAGCPKVIHLMRGQVYMVEGKKIFTFGGGNSVDKGNRTIYKNWWPQEMPVDAEYKEAIENLKLHDNKVDYIITHAAPEETMNLFYPNHADERPLNNFLEWIRETVSYKRWYFGHLHEDRDLLRAQTLLWFCVRRMDTNEIITDYT